MCELTVPSRPQAVTGLEALFEGLSLAGRVDFTLPLMNEDGTEGSGDLGYTVVVNGTIKGTGSAPYGQNVSVPVTADSDGTVEISVYCTNADGDSEPAATSLYVGQDTPLAPAGVELSYNAPLMQLQWQPVTQGVHGGYIDPKQVTYTVATAGGEGIKGESISVCTFSEEVALPVKPTAYAYKVTAVQGDKMSGESVSNQVVLYDIPLPYENDFATEESVTGYTFINANNDNEEWEWFKQLQNGCVYLRTYGNNDKNDWMVTPKLHFEKGNIYKFTCDMKCSLPKYPERVCVTAGLAPTAEAMDITVMDTTMVDKDEWYNYQGYIDVPESGDYYVGIHAMSDPGMYMIFVDNLKVSAPMTGETPLMPDSLVVIPDVHGALTAEIRVKAPACTYNGNPLEGFAAMSKIEVRRDGNLICAFDNPSPGEWLSYMDTVPKSYYYDYDAVAYNRHGVGPAAVTTEFIGVRKPAAPESVKIYETGVPGEIKVTWTPVRTDEKGNEILPGQISYAIVQPDHVNEFYASNIAGTDSVHTIRIVDEGQQQFIQVAVRARTDYGYGPATVSNFMASGDPYTLPFRESFANAGYSHIWGVRRINGNPVWAPCTDLSLKDKSASDGDNGYLAMKATAVDDESRFFSGIIDLAGAEHPHFSFSTYNVFDSEGSKEPNPNELSVWVREVNETAESENWERVTEPAAVDSICGHVPGEWADTHVDLSAYSGKKIQVGVQAKAKYYTYTMLDNFRLEEYLDHDLVAAPLEAPASVNAGDTIHVSLRVTNHGINRAEGYNVNFMGASGESLLTIVGTALEPNETRVYTLADPTDKFQSQEVRRYTATVDYGPDMSAANNTTEPLAVEVRVVSLPSPGNLTVTGNENNLPLLSWEAPVIDNGFEQKQEDFESFPSFSSDNYDHWTFIDRDLSPVGGVEGLPIPGLTSGESLCGFFVFDNAEPVFNSSFDAQSGTKMLASMFRYDDKQTDDWAISPLLSGNSQTIKFHARSYTSQYPEKLEFYYTLKPSLDPEDYTRVAGASVSQVPMEWTEYSVKVPEGAMHFALRSCATGGFFLFVDDVQFELHNCQEAGRTDLAATGYNVYRDRIKVNEATIEGQSWLDASCPEGNHEYHVKAVFNNGLEGLHSEPVEYEYISNGVGMVQGGENPWVRCSGGSIIVERTGGLEVVISNVNGMVVYRSSGDAAVDVVPGAYTVTVAGKTVKVVV